MSVMICIIGFDPGMQFTIRLLPVGSGLMLSIWDQSKLFV
jgi:hypothetical protein